MGNARVVFNFVVVKCGHCILGNTTPKELGVLHIAPKASPTGRSCNEVMKSRVTLPTSSKLITLKCSQELANLKTLS